MSRIYEALQKADGESGSNQSKTKLDFVLFKDHRHSPKIKLDLDPYVEEQYQKLRRRLLADPKQHAQVMMVAATNHGEGATTTAVMLAAYLAKSKNSKVLLIDANFRTPAIDDVFQTEYIQAGLSDLILSESSLEKSICKTNLPNLFVLPCGKPVSSPSYIFDGDSMNDLLGTLRQHFDFIIFDASPLRNYSESSFLAPKVDGVIVVVEAERTKSEVLRRVAKDLESDSIHILGVVLNKKKKYVPDFIERFL